jgi:intein/homing endonuclease
MFNTSGSDVAKKMGLNPETTFCASWYKKEIIADTDVYDLTVPDADCFVTNGIITHNSMACPFAVGVATLVLSEKRKENPNIKLNIEEYRKILASNTISVKNLDTNLDKNGSRFWQGLGIINPNEFENWVEYRNTNEIKKQIIALTDKIGTIKKQSLKNEITQALQILHSKIGF